MTKGKENMHKSKYDTNKRVRTKIDKLLHENAQIWANLGTGTPLDVKTRDAGERKWKNLAKEIKKLDEDFFNRICPYGIDS